MTPAGGSEGEIVGTFAWIFLSGLLMSAIAP